MKVEDIKMVAVIGAGTMGHRIAQVSAQAGYRVRVVDQNMEVLPRALDKVKSNLQRFVVKDLITERDADDSLSRIKWTLNLAEG